VTWDDLLGHVLPSVRGCPDDLALDHLVKAARAFCSRTLVWNYATVPMETAAGVARYTLQLHEGHDLVRMLSCQVGTQAYEVPKGLSGRVLQRNSDSQLTCLVEGNNDIVLDPAPTADGVEILTEVVVKPSLLEPADWPSDLEAYVDDLAAGALSTLLAMSKAEWGDTKQAAINADRFADRIQTVAIQVSRGFGRTRHGGAIRWF
jgi:hypothetical protein